MREHAADGDPLERAPAELLEVLSERRVEVDGASLHQRHDREGGAERFRKRGNIENRVRSHGDRLREERPVAEGPVIEDLVAATDEDDDPGDVAGRDSVAGSGIHGG
jgi:hypothetical protein